MRMALASKEYWDERYKQDPQPFDWYQRYKSSETFKAMLAHHLEKTSHALVVGCGSSRLSEELFADEFTNLQNVDFSSVVISQLNDRYRALGCKVENTLMDICSMVDIEDGSFDAVIDKATLDSMLCADGGAESVERMLREVSRVLKPGGHFLLLSNQAPEELLSRLEEPALSWSCATTQTVAKPSTAVASKASGHSVHHFYVMRRHQAG